MQGCRSESSHSKRGALSNHKRSPPGVEDRFLRDEVSDLLVAMPLLLQQTAGSMCGVGALSERCEKVWGHWSEPGPWGWGVGKGARGAFRCLLHGKKGGLHISLKAQNRFHCGGDLGSPSEPWEGGSQEGWRWRAGETGGLLPRAWSPLHVTGWGTQHWSQLTGEGEASTHFAHFWNLRYSFKLLRVLECHEHSENCPSGSGR